MCARWSAFPCRAASTIRLIHFVRWSCSIEKVTTRIMISRSNILTAACQSQSDIVKINGIPCLKTALEAFLSLSFLRWFYLRSTLVGCYRVGKHV
jgi:hypothetical protein